jgi:outer membrane biosynthesis protein TonB
MKSLSAASVPIAVNAQPTLGKTPEMRQPAPSLTENRPYGIGEVDSKPGILGQALPPYPHRARRRGVEGWVKVRFLITAEGRVRRSFGFAGIPQRGSFKNRPEHRSPLAV